MFNLKNKKKVIIAAGVIVAAAAVGGTWLSANAATQVSSYTVERGTVDRILEVNGNVETQEKETYYSKVNAKIGSVNVKEGDFVKKGDVLVSFDQDEIDYMLKLEELKAEAERGAYDNAMQQNSKISSLNNEANVNLAILNQQIADYQAAYDRLSTYLVDKRVDLSYEGENLQDKLAKATPGTSEYENLEKAVRENAYNQQFSGDIIETQKELNKLATHLAYCKEYKAEMTSQKAATQTAVLTSGQKENLEATKETSELVCAHNVANLETAKKGIVAEFDGIVTTVSATEGSNVAEGTDLVTLDSTENIILKLSVNKYDIVNVEEGQKATVRIKNKDYTGTVSRIARMTDKGAVGVGVEVTLDEPDDDIILGLEAKVKITSASKENVLRIPLDAIMGDDMEEYVYVYNNKKAVKKNIEIGVKNDDYAEVISGLSEGDIVVWNDAIELTDGCDVKVNQ